MKAAFSFLILSMFAESLFAALPPATVATCREKRRVNSLAEVTSADPAQLNWSCLDLSGMAKVNLIDLARKPTTPSLQLQTSRAGSAAAQAQAGLPLNREDFLEIHRYKSLTVEVNSDSLNRMDIQTLQKAGIQMILMSSALPTFNVNDYREIASTGPVVLELTTSTLTPAEILLLAAEPNLKMVIDPGAAKLSAQDQQKVMAIAPQTQMRF